MILPITLTIAGAAAILHVWLAARVSRQLALLRAHGLIARLGKTHRYKVTRKGRAVITAFLAAAQADTQQLTKLAA